MKSFVEFIKFIFTLPDVKEHKLAFLSNNLCQDPQDIFFGCQRQRGGMNDNPTVQDYYTNTQALRVVNSFCQGTIIRGNCRGTREDTDKVTEKHCTPLPRRTRKRKRSL